MHFNNQIKQVKKIEKKQLSEEALIQPNHVNMILEVILTLMVVTLNMFNSASEKPKELLFHAVLFTE